MKNFARITALVVVVAMSVAILAGCAPSDYTKAEAHLQDKGYAVITVSDAAALDVTEAALKVAGVEVKLVATVSGTTDDEAVTVYYFEDTDSAKAFFNYRKKITEDYKADITKRYEAGSIKKDTYDELMEDIKETKLGKSGKAVYFGTDDGVRAL